MNQKEKYRLFCREEKSLPIFFQDWYLDAVYGDEWDVLIFEHDNRKIIGAFPFCKKKKLFFKYIRTRSFGRTMGIYITPSIKGTKREIKIVRNLLSQLPQVHYFEQNFLPSFTDWLPFYWNGFQQTTRYTYIIDNLQDLDSVWNNFIPDYRNNKIKIAESLLTVRHDLTLKDFYVVSKKTFERQKIVIPYSFEDFEKMDIALAKNNARKMFFAMDNQNQIHAVLYLVWDNETAYYHIAGDDEKLRSSGASILLAYKAIEFSSKTLKLNRFDFEGSMLLGVERVRRNFGAKQIPYFTLRKFKPSFLSLIYDLKNMFSK